jgi:hypothetical protein
MYLELILLFALQGHSGSILGIPVGVDAHKNYDYVTYQGDGKTNAKGEFFLDYKKLYGGPLPVAPSCNVEDTTKPGPIYFKDERSHDHVIFLASSGHVLHYVCKARIPKKGKDAPKN